MPAIFRRPLVGLALGGGGARGLAHIGVLKVFSEAGIPIDYLAGTSMGGLIAASYASGLSPTQLEAEALTYAEIGHIIKLVDLGFPRRGLLSAERIRQYLAQIISPQLQFSDLYCPVVLACVDLRHAEIVPIENGPVLDAILATIAVPGIFPAIAKEDRLLVDGGVLNNVPTDLVRSQGAELTIAVDVGHQYPGEQPELTATALPEFASFLPRFALDFYNAEMIMINALVESRLQRHPAHILIRPPIPGNISVFFGFPHAAEAIAAGEGAARQALPEIQRHLVPRLRFPRTLPPKLE